MTVVGIVQPHTDRGLLIEARGVVRSFGPTPALRGADLSVTAGEILAVMGPSGSGKSTLLHCLAGILTPDAGEIWYAGQRIDTMRENERSALRRDRFGFVFQSGQLVPELTAEETSPCRCCSPESVGSMRSRGPATGSRASAWTAWPGAGRENCPAARPNGWRWPGPWSRNRTSCSLTSRPGRSTRSWASW